MLPRTGVLMQNRGIAFSLDPDRAHALKPGRRPFHTLNPALAVFADGRVMSYGSMGGDGQPQFQAQVFTRIAAGADARRRRRRAAPLWGRTWGATSVTVKVEAAYDDATAAALARAGHEVERRAPRSDLFGHAGALVRPQGRDRRDPRSARRRRAGRIVSFGLSRPAHPEAISVRSLPLHTSLLRNDTFPARGEENGQSRCDSRRRWVSGPADRPPQSLFQP